MAWRYRRSKSLGPFRMTATKGGLGFSFGGPLGRISVNTRGQVRETTRIPGIGLYQTQKIAQLGGSHHSSPHAPAQTSHHSSVPHVFPHHESADPITAALPVAAAGSVSSNQSVAQRSRAKVIALTILLIFIETFVFLFLLGWIGSVNGPGWLALLLMVAFVLIVIQTIRSARAPKQAAPPAVSLPPTPTPPTTNAARPATSGSIPTPTTATTGSIPEQIAVSARDATGGNLHLDPLSPEVVSLKVVGITNSVAELSDAIKLSAGTDGLRHGVHEGLLVPTGTEWRVYCLIHAEDNPELFEDMPSTTAISTQVGRLSLHDVRTYAPLFDGHPVQVALYIEATPSLERLEVRFLNKPIPAYQILTATPAPTAATTTATELAPETGAPIPALPPTGWFTDPTSADHWRWWDGAAWTMYTAPKVTGP